MKELENKMLIDEYWLDYDDVNQDDDDEIFYALVDEEYDDEVACLAERGWGHMNGYYL